MKEYANVYSDISYTLSSEDAMKIIANDFRQPGMVDKYGTPLINKLMYGTDFYMTQAEATGDEPHLQNMASEHFTHQEMQLIAYQNPARFLQSKIPNLI